MNLAALNSLPSAFWAIAGSIITGIISLIGIYLTNRANTKRQETERNMALRREVYLSAVEAIAALQSHLGGLIDISKALPATEIAAGLAALSKVYLIGTEATIRAVMTFVNQFLKAYARLTLERTILSAKHTGLTPLELGREWIAFARDFKNACFPIAKYAAPAFLALRRELDLEIDEAMTLSMFNEGLGENIAVTDKFIDDIEKHLDEKTQS